MASRPLKRSQMMMRTVDPVEENTPSSILAQIDAETEEFSEKLLQEIPNKEWTYAETAAAAKAEVFSRTAKYRLVKLRNKIRELEAEVTRLGGAGQ